MKQHTIHLKLRTDGRGLIDFTAMVESWLAGRSVITGVLTVFCVHTSASLLIQENAAPEVRSDLIAFFDRIVPENPRLYAHDDEGPDDMPAHIRSALTATSLTIPVVNGRMALGTWQGVYLFEHRAAPHRRSVVLHLIG